MVRSRGTSLIAIAAGIGALWALLAAQVPAQTPRIVRQIDHVLIESAEPESLFSLLSETFQLPVVWPMSDYGRFASGGVAAGNVNLEVIRAPAARAGGARSRWAGFALEPEPLVASLAELQARGISHGAPAPFTSKGPDGSAITLWTTVGLPSVSHDAAPVFLCEYAFDVPARRRQSLEELRVRRGGPLSIRSVREIVLGSTDVRDLQARWQALLAPRQPSPPGVWALGAGPAVRVAAAPQTGVRGLVVTVDSLPEARRFLAERGLLGEARQDQLVLNGPDLTGLNITLVEGGGM